MRLDKAKALVHSILESNIMMIEGASREALRNAEQDLLLLIEDIYKQGLSLDQTLAEAEELTRRDPERDQ